MKNSPIDLAAIRAEYKKAPQFASTPEVREAVICKIYYTKTKYTIGVQYWTADQCKAGSITLSDGNKSEYVAMLYVGANPLTV